MAEQPINPDRPVGADNSKQLQASLGDLLPHNDGLTADSADPGADDSTSAVDSELEEPRPNLVLRMALPFFRILFPDLDEVRPNRPVPAAPAKVTVSPAEPQPAAELPESTITIIRWNFKLLAWLILLSVALGFGVQTLHGRQVARLAETFRDRAERARQAGQLKQYRSDLNRYVTLVPHDTDALAELADVQEQAAETRSDFRLVYRLLQQVCQRDESRHTLRRRLIRLAIDLGRYEEALSQLETLQRTFPRDAELLLLAGQVLEQQGEYAAAAQSYEAAIQVNPRQISAYAPLANLLDRQLGRASQSGPWLDQMVNANPRALSAYLTRAIYNLRRGDYRAASEDVQRARKLTPDNLDLDLLEARLALAMGSASPWNTGAITDRLRERLTKHADDGRLYTALFDLEQLNSAPGDQPPKADPRDASDGWLRRGLAVVPRDFDLRIRLIASLIEQQDLPGAEDQLTQLEHSAASASQIGWASDCFRGYMALQSDQWLDAATLLEGVRPDIAAIPLLQQSVDLWLAAAYKSMRNHEQEVAAYRRALEIHPASLAARQGLAAALAADGRYDDAMAHLRIVEDADGVPLRIARLLIRKNMSLAVSQRDWAGVARAIDAAERSGADPVEVTLLRARRNELAQRPDRARDILQAATQDHPEEVNYWVALARFDQRQLGSAAGLERLAAAAKIHPDRVELWLVRIDCVPLNELNDIEARLDQFPVETQVALMQRLAAAYRKFGRMQMAARLLSRATQLRTPDMALLLIAFEAALNAGDLQSSEAHLTRIAQLEGRNGPHVQSGRIAMLIAQAERGTRADTGRARTLLASLRQTHTRWPDLPLLEARMLILEGKRGQAARYDRQALEAGTRNENVLLRLVQYHAQQQDTATANTLLRTYGKQFDLHRSPVLLDAAVEMAWRAGDVPRALELAERWVQIAPDDYHAHLRIGRLHQHLQEPGPAVESLRRASVLEPQDPVSARLLLDQLLRMGRLSEAKRVFEEFNQRQNLSAENSPLLFARYYEQVGLPDRATETYRAAVARLSHEPRVLLAAAEYFLRTNDANEAERLLRRITSLESRADLRLPEPGQTAPGQSNLATNYNHQQQEVYVHGRRLLASVLAARGYPMYQEALQLLEPDRGEPATTDDLLMKARLLVQRPYWRNRRDAIGILETVAASADGLAEKGQLLLAQVYDLNGDAQRADRLWNRLVTNHQDETTFLVPYINRAIDQRQYDEAANRLRRLKKVSSVDEAVLFAVEVRLLAHTGAIDELTSRIDEWVKSTKAPEQRGKRLRHAAGILDDSARAIEPADEHGARPVRREAERRYRQSAKNDVAGQLALVGFLGRSRQFHEAFTLCKSMRADAPAEMLAPQLVALARSGKLMPEQTTEIGDWLAEAAQQKPESAVVWQQLAALRYLQGQPDEAVRHYRTALRLDPDNGVVLNNLAWTLAVIQKTPVEAENLINRAITANGPEPYLLDTQAVVFLKLDRNDQAVRSLKNALATADSATARLHLALAYQRMGNRPLATQELRRATALGLTEASVEAVERPALRQLVEWVKKR